MKYAGFWRRLVAVTIDEFLIGIVAYAILSVVVLIALYIPPVTQAKYDYFFNYGAIIGNFAIGFLYFAWFEGKTGETVGKKLMKLKLIRLDQPNRDGVGIGRAALRLVFAFVLQIFAGVNYILMLLSPERLTLQDTVFKTAVVYDPSGTFPNFDPDKLSAAPRRWPLFAITLALSFLSVVGQIIYLSGLL